MAHASTFGFTPVPTWAADGEPVEVIWPGLACAELFSEVAEDVFVGCVVVEVLHEPMATNKRQDESIRIQRISTLLQTKN